LRLARRLTVIEDGNPDPNALLPQRVEIDLAEGRAVAAAVTSVLGSPERPLSPEAARAKFRDCWQSVHDIPPDQGAALWDAVIALETLEDVSPLSGLGAPRGAP
jgi:aconitate decarboxylase